MSNPRRYATNAERQKAYRTRKVIRIFHEEAAEAIRESLREDAEAEASRRFNNEHSSDTC